MGFGGFSREALLHWPESCLREEANQRLGLSNGVLKQAPMAMKAHHSIGSAPENAISPVQLPWFWVHFPYKVQHFPLVSSLFTR